MCLRGLATLALFVIAQGLFADIPSPGARGHLNIHVRFDNLKDYPDYTFYLKYGIGDANPYESLRLMKLDPGVSMRMPGQGSRLTEVALIAVPAGVDVSIPKEPDKKKDWLEKKPEGALQTPWLEISAMDDGNLLIYRVSIEGKHIDAHLQAPPEPTPPILIATIGIVIVALVLGAAAFWFLRRPSDRGDEAD